MKKFVENFRKVGLKKFVEGLINVVVLTMPTVLGSLIAVDRVLGRIRHA